jgi:recombination protein RecT
MSTEIAIPTTRQFEIQLANYMKGMGSLVPKDVASRIMRLMMVEATMNPQIRECTTASVMRAVYLSAQLALEVGPVKGELYMIPRSTFIGYEEVGGQKRPIKEMQLTTMVGYKGYITLARRSGQISMIDAHVVFEGDAYDISLGTDPRLSHIPQKGIDRKNPDGIVAAYCVVRLKDGSTYFEWLWKDEIDQRRAKGAKNGPWSTDYAAMARKTAIRALFTGGRVPMADQIGLATLLDEEASPEQTRAALATMAEEMREKGLDASIIEAVPEPTQEAPAPTPAKNALGIPQVSAGEMPTLEALKALESALPPAEMQACRKVRKIPPDAKIESIPTGYWPGYAVELHAALKGIQ